MRNIYFMYFVIIFFIGCDTNNEYSTPLPWISDVKPLNSKLSPSYEIISGEWTQWTRKVGGIFSIPSPNEVFLVGLLHLDSVDAQKIRNEYTFMQIIATEEQDAIEQTLRKKGGIFQERTIQALPQAIKNMPDEVWLYSEKFMNEFLSTTAQWQILILLGQQNDIVFVYLISS